MEATWEQLGNPTKPGIVNAENIGSVLITDYDLTFPSPNDFKVVLVSNKPESDWKIGSWTAKGQIFYPNPMVK